LQTNKRNRLVSQNLDSKRILKTIFLGICLVFTLGVSAAHAEVLYSAQPDSSGDLAIGWSSNAGAQQIAQDFSLASEGTVTTISVFGLSTAGGVNNDPQAFVLEFFNDNSGAPETTSFYSTTTAAIAGVDTGVTWGNWTIYKYTFNVPSQSLSAGTTYWLGAKSTGTGWNWAAASTDGSGGIWVRTLDDAAWSKSPQDTRDNQAFELEGDDGIVYTCIDPFDAPFDVPLTLKSKKNSTLPVKMQLFDADGYVVTDADLSASPVISVSFAPSSGGSSEDVSDDVLPAGKANDDNIFRYDLEEDKFIYNLSTKSYKASGEYTVTAVAGDSSYEIEGCSETFTRN
jgi:hypothetical protein